MDDIDISPKVVWTVAAAWFIALVLFLSTGDWNTVWEIYFVGLICLGIGALVARLCFSWANFLEKISTDFGTLEKFYEKTKKSQDEIYSELRTVRSMIDHATEKNDALKSAVVATLKKLHETAKNAPQSKADEARKQVLGLNE